MKAKYANALPCHGVGPTKYLMLLFVVASVFFSCNKDATQATKSADTVENIAATVNGLAEEGSIVTNNDENGAILLFNKGSKYVLIQKIPGTLMEDVSSIQRAVLITSKYGIIVKDVTNNKMFLFANNDEESLQKFEAIKQGLHCSYVSTTIFGTTVIDASKT